MKRRSFNVFSFVFGLVLILLAGWVAFPSEEWMFDFPKWLFPAGMIVVGAALISPLFTSWTRKTVPEEGSDAHPTAE